MIVRRNGMSNKAIHRFACGHLCEITKSYQKKLLKYEFPERVKCYQCQLKRKQRSTDYGNLPSIQEQAE